MALGIGLAFGFTQNMFEYWGDSSSAGQAELIVGDVISMISDEIVEDVFLAGMKVIGFVDPLIVSVTLLRSIHIRMILYVGLIDVDMFTIEFVFLLAV